MRDYIILQVPTYKRELVEVREYYSYANGTSNDGRRTEYDESYHSVYEPSYVKDGMATVKMPIIIDMQMYSKELSKATAIYAAFKQLDGLNGYKMNMPTSIFVETYMPSVYVYDGKPYTGKPSDRNHDVEISHHEGNILHENVRDCNITIEVLDEYELDDYSIVKDIPIMSIEESGSGKNFSIMPYEKIGVVKIPLSINKYNIVLGARMDKMSIPEGKITNWINSMDIFAYESIVSEDTEFSKTWVSEMVSLINEKKRLA